MCSSAPAGRPVPRVTALPMLRSTIETVSAPAISPFRGSITHPTHPLCTLRGRRCRRLTQHSLPGGLLGLTWVGLAPTDRASFLGAFLEFELRRRVGAPTIYSNRRRSPVPRHGS